MCLRGRLWPSIVAAVTPAPAEAARNRAEAARSAVLLPFGWLADGAGVLLQFRDYSGRLRLWVNPFLVVAKFNELDSGGLRIWSGVVSSRQPKLHPRSAGTKRKKRCTMAILRCKPDLSSSYMANRCLSSSRPVFPQATSTRIGSMGKRPSHRSEAQRSGWQWATN